MRTSTADRTRLHPIPTRAAIAIAGTVLGLVLLFSFKTPDQPPPRAAGGLAPNGVQAPGPSSGAAATPGNPGTARTIAGDDVPNQYGDVQVQVTFSGRKIIDVKALQLPSDRARSAEISNYVEPYLRSEALQAQSAQIDLISGATYTSESYAQSLQSAIDKAGG
jgi:FMN-binding domain